MKFPKITGMSLPGVEVTLPDAAYGKVALIIVAFIRQSPGVVDSWLAPYERKFGADPSCTFYEVPMLEGYWTKKTSGIIEEGMRQGIPEKMHENIITYYGNTERFCAILEIIDKSRCYVFLLDRHGTIRLRGHGAGSTGEVQKLLRLAQELSEQKEIYC